MGARILTAVIGIPLLLYAVGAENDWVLRIVLGAIGLVALLEFRRLEVSGMPVLAGNLVLAAFLTALCFWRPQSAASPLLLAVYAIPLMEWRGGMTPRPMLFAGWVLLPLLSAISLRAGSLPEPSGWGISFQSNALLLLLVCLWAGDSMAYFVGKAIGKHKMVPNISPAKTWEGAAANLLACVAVGYALSRPLELPSAFGILLGGIAGVVGQEGDLFQSLWKRRHGAKDSGAILPGHGGVLDRFDSLLFCLPAANAAAHYWLG